MERNTMNKLIRRHRRFNETKALKPFSPIFTVSTGDVMADLTGDR